jgi:hypothetical protein
MTVAPERNDTDLAIPTDMPVVARGLIGAFDARHGQLAKLGALLSAGEIRLNQRVVALAPYIGHSVGRMATINKMASGGNQLAHRERTAVTAFHMPTRYTPLVGFLAQFPPSWRQLLLATLREDVTRIELKAGPDHRVVEVVTWHSRTLYEYGLRAFNLTFVQVRQIAAWMRDNEELLPTIAVHMPPARKGDDKAEAARYAALIAFFDNMPEKMRDLLVAKARPELVGIHFETMPTGDVVLRVMHR